MHPSICARQVYKSAQWMELVDDEAKFGKLDVSQKTVSLFGIEGLELHTALQFWQCHLILPHLQMYTADWGDIFMIERGVQF